MAGAAGSGSDAAERARGWEHFEHMADVGLRGFGSTPQAAFAGCALALIAVMTDPAGVRPLVAVPIACHSDDRELLLVDWLNALIWEMTVRGMLFAEFDVELSDGRLTATARGEPIDPARHELAVEPKGATLTELRVAPCAGGWVAQCVVDV